jgi:hypothetical protein
VEAVKTAGQAHRYKRDLHAGRNKGSHTTKKNVISNTTLPSRTNKQAGNRGRQAEKAWHSGHKDKLDHKPAGSYKNANREAA